MCSNFTLQKKEVSGWNCDDFGEDGLNSEATGKHKQYLYIMALIR
jgi:hypothetical protein